MGKWGGDYVTSPAGEPRPCEIWTEKIGRIAVILLMLKSRRVSKLKFSKTPTGNVASRGE